MQNYKKYKKGQISIEFILVLPAMLFLTLFMIEMSLMWRDHHVLRYANYEAARVVSNSNIINPCNSQQVLSKARRAAAIRISAIAPRVDTLIYELARGLGIDSLPRFEVPNIAGSRVAKAASRMALGYPAAITLTSINCEEINGDYKVELSYLRSPKTPFVRDALWAMYCLSIWNNKVEEYVPIPNLPKLEVSHRDFRTLEFDSINIGNVISQNLELQEFGAVNNYIDQGSDWLNKLKQINTTLNREIPKFNELSSIPLVADQNNEVDFDLNIPSIINVLGMGDMMNLEVPTEFAEVLQKFIYLVPKSLRMIPMKVDTKISRVLDEKHEKPWKANFLGLTKFSEDGLSNADDAWTQWAKGMQDNKANMKGHQ